MGREDDAALYFVKMAEASRMHKKQLVRASIDSKWLAFSLYIM